MKLRCGNVEVGCCFSRVPLEFEGMPYQDVFGLKNNKTVAETLDHRRYANFRTDVVAKYPYDLAKPLGSFLLELKRKQDMFYKQFLNKYGDLTYSTFKIAASPFLDSKGIYAYMVGDEVKYIGRCKDNMRKRVNQGYGKIHPKNCYLDGQATNCHLNAKIAAERSAVTLWLHEMESAQEIESLEREIIREVNPSWNIQRG